MIILCIFLPPVAALISGGILSFIFNCILTLLGWIPGVIHALIVVNNKKQDKRAKKIVDAIKESKK